MSSHPVSAKLKLILTGLLLALAISFSPSRIEVPRTLSNQAEAVLESGEQIHIIPSRRPVPANESARSDPIPASTEKGKANLSWNPILHEPSGEASGWKISYGREFWRRGRTPSESKSKGTAASSSV